MCKVLERIKTYIDYKGITISTFEKSVGMSNSSFGKQLKNKGAIGSDKLENILSTYSDLSPEWLFTGNGEMIKPQSSSLQQSQISIPIHHKIAEDVDAIRDSKITLSQTRPRIPYRAAAGSLSIAINSVAEDDCERIPLIPTFPKYDFTIIAKGESMSPDIQSGDELACRFITESSFIQWGRPHVIDTAQGIVVKRLYDGGDNIICRSCNKEHDDFLVPKDEIYHIALVVGLLRQY